MYTLSIWSKATALDCPISASTCTPSCKFSKPILQSTTEAVPSSSGNCAAVPS